MEIGFWLVSAFVGVLGIGVGSLFLMGGKSPQTTPAPNETTDDEDEEGDEDEEEDGEDRDDWDETIAEDPAYRATIETANRIRALMAGPAWKEARDRFERFVDESLSRPLGLREDAEYNLEDIAGYVDAPEDEDLGGDQKPTMSPDEGKRRLEEIMREVNGRLALSYETVTRAAAVVDGTSGDKPRRIISLLDEAERDNEEALTAIGDRLDEVLDNCC